MAGSVYHQKKDRLGDLLVASGAIAVHQLDRALAHQQTVDGRLGEILLSLGYISEEDLVKALAQQIGADVYSPEPGHAFLDCEISEPFHREHPFLVVQRSNDATPLLVVSDPFDGDLMTAAGLLYGWSLDLALATGSEIQKQMALHYGVNTSQEEDGRLEVQEADIDRLKDMASEAPVIKYVNHLIDTAVSRRASDIHLEPMEDGLKVRFRIDGTLHDYEIPPAAIQPAIVSRTKLLAGLDIAERRLPQDGKIGMRISGKEIDLRVSTLPSVHGESVVIRILEKGSVILNLSGLGMSPSMEQAFKKLINLPDGILLVTGPTGSGKTTTLYCALHHINTGEKKIITVEDPVEYQLPGITQIQVRPEIGLTFAKGLRSIVRQDPDVIMVGEIRDLDTAEIAVQSSLTGHLVFSTLHTNDAPSAVIRLADLGVERFLIAASLRGVLAQRLVRKICPQCKKAIGPASEFGVKPEGEDDFTVFAGEGCTSCGHTGYSGRIGIYELLVVDDAINRVISRGDDLDALRRTAEKCGFLSMFHDGLDKVRQGITTPAEVMRVCRSTANGTV